MVLLFGFGLGSVFYKWMADRSDNLWNIAITNRQVVLADWFFTTPTVIIQPVTGIWMAHLIGLPLTTPWLFYALVLYALALACWLPVVWLQIRMRDIAHESARDQIALPPQYWQYRLIWLVLGGIAFPAMLTIVWLMVFKPV